MLKQLAAKRLRLPRLGTHVPDPEDPKIFWFNSERDDIVQEVVRRLMERNAEEEEQLEYVLNDVAHHEVLRLESQKDGETDASLDEWRSLIRRVGRMSNEGKHETLREICERMAYDVAGNFDPRVYRFAARMVPGLLTAVMNPSSLVHNVLDSATNRLEHLIASEGPIEKLQRLSRLGTLVLVPTHSSNLDSLAVAWVLYRESLPPVVYGAGKNLFTNPIISFFMHNLGAYRLDRRVRAQLYKDVLKKYSCVMIERGYHSLFFPGGRRARSGEVEDHLKLGLAGTGVEAFARNATRGIRRPVFFVPATINYDLVLEAETLVDDYLKERGRGRYIIADDEFSQIDRWIAFFHRMRGLDAGCVIRFGDPVDPFCNPVDADGRSLAPGGRTIDPVGYVCHRGSPSVDHARDAAYTRELGDLLAGVYKRETVIMPTQLVAHVLFRRMVRATPGLDLFARLRHKGDVAVPRDELVQEVGQARDALLQLELAGRVHVSGTLRREGPATILDRSLAIWNGYHTRMVAREMNGSVIIEDPNLLLFYQNRLRKFAQMIAPESEMNAAREIENMELVA